MLAPDTRVRIMREEFDWQTPIDWSTGGYSDEIKSMMNHVRETQQRAKFIDRFVGTAVEKSVTDPELASVGNAVPIPEKYEAHVDLIVNQWALAYQQRVGQVRAWGTSWHAEKALKLIGESMDSSYFTVTEPHSDDDCPFKDGDRLEMIYTPYDNEANQWALLVDDQEGIDRD